VQQQLAPVPARVGPATLTIQIANAAQEPIAHATLEAEADMSHPGMAPVFGAVEETTPGNYQAHLSFTMAGDWVVLLHIKLPDGRKMVRQVDVRGVQPN
jgi:YtkA-like